MTSFAVGWHRFQKIGEAYFRTPRNTIKGFLDLLAIIDQNPGTDWRALTSATEIAPDAPPAGGDIIDEPGPIRSFSPATSGGEAAPGAKPGGDDLDTFRL